MNKKCIVPMQSGNLGRKAAVKRQIDLKHCANMTVTMLLLVWTTLAPMCTVLR